MTTATYLRLEPRDPLIARDGRPFGAGLRMRSLDWLYPSVLAGSLRTLLGNLRGGFPPAAESEYAQLTGSLKQLTLAGPFPEIRGELHFAAPQDMVVRKGDDSLEAFGMRPVPLRQWGGNAGCNLPAGLEPALLPEEVEEDFKPEKLPAFWSCAEMTRWLINADGGDFLPRGTKDWPPGALHGPVKDSRTHVKMDSVSGAGKTEDGLFQSVGIDLYRLPDPNLTDDRGPHGPQPALSVQIEDVGGFQTQFNSLDCLSPLGGERRLCRWQAVAGPPQGWSCPKGIGQELERLARGPNGLVRMVLATPAIFREGWRPGWLEPLAQPTGANWLVGEIPGTAVQVHLIGACIDRWRPVSGWGYEPVRQTDETGKPVLKYGPKAVRRLVPAGGVYFFRVLAGDPTTLAKRWLKSVCDETQDGRDGFGLALWGVWRPFDPGYTFGG